MKVVEGLRSPFESLFRRAQDERERGAGADWGFELG